MTQGLNRYQFVGDLHFVTFSCDQRRPYLAQPSAKRLFEEALERMRQRYDFAVIGYVVMPEHVHLLLSEPAGAPLSKAIHSLKSSVAKSSKQRPFWLPRYYDFNVYTARKRVEKLSLHAPQPNQARTCGTTGRLGVVELLPLRDGKAGNCRH